MAGPRLVTGLIAMGLVTPLLLFFLLGLERPIDLLVLSVTCFSTWGVADLIGNLLSRPRLEHRSPTDALKSIENLQKKSGDRKVTEEARQSADQA